MIIISKTSSANREGCTRGNYFFLGRHVGAYGYFAYLIINNNNHNHNNNNNNNNRK